MMNNNQSSDSGEEISSEPIAPEQTGNDSWKYKSKEERNDSVIFVLILDNPVIIQI